MECPHCGERIHLPAAKDDEIDDLAALRAACLTIGIAVSWDGYVREGDAARLLGKSPKTLRNRRYEGASPRHRKADGRIEYALDGIAKWRAAGQKNID